VIYLKIYIESGQKNKEQKLKKKWFSSKRFIQCKNRKRLRYAQILQEIEPEKKSSQRNENKNDLDANDILNNVKMNAKYFKSSRK